jgi:hypothetical protein
VIANDESVPNIEPPDATLIPQPRWLPRLLILFCIALVLMAVFGLYLRYRPLPFDPAVWLTANGTTRGRMLGSLLEQTDFVGFTRPEVEAYLGKPEFDDRLFWYDLGPDSAQTPIDPRAAIGDPARLYGVFHHDRGGIILEVLYNHRRPTLGSAKFDSAGWFGGDPAVRRTMFLNALGKLRNLGLTRDVVQDLLGPPDGHRVRAQYDVGFGGAIYGTRKALILTYDDGNVVTESKVTD